MARTTFDELFVQAEQAGAEYFGWVNADIIVLPKAIETMKESRREAYIFSRCDVEPETMSPKAMFTRGMDMFVYRLDWWRKNRERFRNYVNSEGFWDPTYTAITLCHSDGVLLNAEPLILHETHPVVWSNSPYFSWNLRLCVRDGLYFFVYWKRFADAQAMNGWPVQREEEAAEQQRVIFRWPPKWSERALWGLRRVKGEVAYALDRVGVLKSRGYA